MEPIGVYTKSGLYFYPAIRHEDGRIEKLEGPPHATLAVALKYARLEIAERRNKRIEREKQ